MCDKVLDPLQFVLYTFEVFDLIENRLFIQISNHYWPLFGPQRVKQNEYASTCRGDLVTSSWSNRRWFCVSGYWCGFVGGAGVCKFSRRFLLVEFSSLRYIIFWYCELCTCDCMSASGSASDVFATAWVLLVVRLMYLRLHECVWMRWLFRCCLNSSLGHAHSHHIFCCLCLMLLNVLTMKRQVATFDKSW